MTFSTLLFTLLIAYFNPTCRITVQMDDAMVRYYTHEDIVLLEVHQINDETHDITLVEVNPWILNSLYTLFQYFEPFPLPSNISSLKSILIFFLICYQTFIFVNFCFSFFPLFLFLFFLFFFISNIFLSSEYFFSFEYSQIFYIFFSSRFLNFVFSFSNSSSSFFSYHKMFPILIFLYWIFYIFIFVFSLYLSPCIFLWNLSSLSLPTTIYCKKTAKKWKEFIFKIEHGQEIHVWLYFENNLSLQIYNWIILSLSYSSTTTTNKKRYKIEVGILFQI